MGATPIMVRMPPDELKRLDGWLAKQSGEPGRPAAIRRLVALGLSASEPRLRGAHKGAAKAKAMAGEQVEQMIDPATPVEERQQRKRRLIKGPSEFREMRSDQPKAKAGP